jgi:hypothetical protein
VGIEISIDANTILVKSPDKRETMRSALEPNTLRTPISLRLLSAEKAARPNRPRQEMMMAMPAKYLESVPTRISDSYKV